MFDISEHSMEVEAIKIALGTLHYRNLEIQPAVRQGIKFLIMQYELSDEKKYLENALFIICAYLSMGGIYEAEQELFDEVLTYLHTAKEEIIPVYFFPNKPIKASKYQIRKLIGKWMPSKNNPMKIGEVIDDIIDKIQNKKQGHYYYKYVEGMVTSPNNIGMYLYKLIITKNECFFYDVKNNKYYRFY